MADLIFNWPVLVLAVVLLWFPPSPFIGKQAKRRLSHQKQAGPFGIVGGILAWQNWFDLLRAYGGCWILMHHAIEVPEPELRSQALMLQGGVLAVALFVQTIRRYHGRAYYLAPVFFVWGITLVLVGPIGGLYGIAIAVIVARVVNDVEWHLPVLAGAVGGAEYLLHGLSRELIIAGVLIILPVLITFLGKGKMLFLMRRSRAAEEE